METGALGKVYQDGEVILHQGDPVDSMYVIQSGQVEVLHEKEDEDDKEVRLTELGEGRFFGEVPLFERVGSEGTVRATVRAMGEVRVLTVDRKTILRRIHEDPSLAYRILQTMSRRIRALEEEVVRLVVGTDGE